MCRNLIIALFLYILIQYYTLLFAHGIRRILNQQHLIKYDGSLSEQQQQSIR